MRDRGVIRRFWHGALGRRSGDADDIALPGDGRNWLRTYLPPAWEIQLMLRGQQITLVPPPTADPPALADELRAMRRRAGRR